MLGGNFSGYRATKLLDHIVSMHQKWRPWNEITTFWKGLPVISSTLTPECTHIWRPLLYACSVYALTRLHREAQTVSDCRCFPVHLIHTHTSSFFGLLCFTKNKKVATLIVSSITATRFELSFRLIQTTLDQNESKPSNLNGILFLLCSSMLRRGRQQLPAGQWKQCHAHGRLGYPEHG